MPKRDYIEFHDRFFARGYLTTFRCYGTLWTDNHIATAVDYVVNGQGGELPQFD